jgi:hypothetical protein
MLWLISVYDYKQHNSVGAVRADVVVALAAVPHTVVVCDFVFVAGVAAVAVGVVLNLDFLG